MILRAVDLLCTPAEWPSRNWPNTQVAKRTVKRLLGLLQRLKFLVYDERDGLPGKKHWKKDDRIMPGSQLSRYFGFETAHSLSPDFG